MFKHLLLFILLSYNEQLTVSSQQTEIVKTVADLMTELQTTTNFIEINTWLLELFGEKGSYNAVGSVLNDVRLLLIELNDEMVNIFESPYSIAGYKPPQTRLETNHVAQQKWNNIDALIHSIMTHAEQLLIIRDTFLSMAQDIGTIEMTSLLSISSNGAVTNEQSKININNDAIQRLETITKSFRQLQEQREADIKQNTIESLQYINKVLYDLPGSVAFDGLLTECLQCSQLHTTLTKEHNQHINDYNNEIRNNYNPATEKMMRESNSMSSVRDSYKTSYNAAIQQNNYKNANYYADLFNAQNEKIKQHNIGIENHTEQLKRFKEKYNAILSRLKIEMNKQLECYRTRLEEMKEAGKKLEIDVLLVNKENDTDIISQNVNYVIEHLEQTKSISLNLAQKELLFKELLGALGDIIVRKVEDENVLHQQQQLNHYLNRPSVNLGHLVPAFNAANIQTLSQFKDSFCETISISIEETEQKRFVKLSNNIDGLTETILNFTEKRKLKQICRITRVT